MWIAYGGLCVVGGDVVFLGRGIAFVVAISCVWEPAMLSATRSGRDLVKWDKM